MTASDPRVGEIAARLDAATPGPWLVNDEEQTVRAEGDEWCGEIMYDRSAEHPTWWVSRFRPDAEFIAHSPADIAYLLAQLRDRDEKLADAWDEGSVAGWVQSGLPHSWAAENALVKANPYRAAVAAAKGGERG